MEHKKTVEKYDGSLKELAEDIGDLHYEVLNEFLGHLRDKLYKDSAKDKEAGRKKLAKALKKAANSINDSQDGIFEAWLISKPYMK